MVFTESRRREVAQPLLFLSVVEVQRVRHDPAAQLGVQFRQNLTWISAGHELFHGQSSEEAGTDDPLRLIVHLLDRVHIHWQFEWVLRPLRTT